MPCTRINSLPSCGVNDEHGSPPCIVDTSSSQLWLEASSISLQRQHATFCCAVRVPATRTLFGFRVSGSPASCRDARLLPAGLSVTGPWQFATGLIAGAAHPQRLPRRRGDLNERERLLASHRRPDVAPRRALANVRRAPSGSGTGSCLPFRAIRAKISWSVHTGKAQI